MTNEKIIKALEHIYRLCPDVVVGGSISFVVRGLLSRQPNDIDLFFPEYASLTSYGLFDCIIDEVGSDTTTDINGKEIQRTSLKIMGVKVCAFKVEDDYLKHEILEYNGVKIQAQFPQYGIIAKKIYSQKNDKHKKDLKEILEKMVQRNIRR